MEFGVGDSPYRKSRRLLHTEQILIRCLLGDTNLRPHFRQLTAFSFVATLGFFSDIEAPTSTRLK
jgi:hypothetical protein